MTWLTFSGTSEKLSTLIGGGMVFASVKTTKYVLSCKTTSTRRKCICPEASRTLIVKEWFPCNKIPPDHMQSGTSTILTQSSWSLSSRGQWKGMWHLGVAVMYVAWASGWLWNECKHMSKLQSVIGQCDTHNSSGEAFLREFQGRRRPIMQLVPRWQSNHSRSPISALCHASGHANEVNDVWPVVSQSNSKSLNLQQKIVPSYKILFPQVTRNVFASVPGPRDKDESAATTEEYRRDEFQCQLARKESD